MTKRIKDARIKNKRASRSVLTLDLDVTTIEQLAKMAKEADVTFSQLVRVLLMLELRKPKYFTKEMVEAMDREQPFQLAEEETHG